MHLLSERRKTCLAYSPGGHKAELDRALEGLSFEDVFHVTFNDGRTANASLEPTYYICHPRRSIWRALWNSLQSAAIILRERPKLIISTGADVAVAIFILGRIAGAKTIFIETGGSLEPTLAGRLTYPFSSLFLVQWRSKKRAFPDAIEIDGFLI